MSTDYEHGTLGFFAWLGHSILYVTRSVGAALLVTVSAFGYMSHLLTSRRARRETVRLMFTMGITSLGVISIVAAFTGMILALQTGLELQKFSQEKWVGAGVLISMLREMGPFMTGLILAASVGSAIAAQLGTMAVSEEIEALEVMSIDPVRFLVMPRLVAMMVMTPLLALFSSALGVAGGALVANTQLGVSLYTFWDVALRVAETKDMWVGAFKSLLFGILITMIACQVGLATRHGAVGVGRSTRRSVVFSFLAILIVGYFVTSLFYR